MTHAATLVGGVAALNALGRARAPALAIELNEMLVASNANVGGPATAAAFAGAAARDPLLVVPATVWGTAGYACATTLGVALFNAFLRSS